MTTYEQKARQIISDEEATEIAQDSLRGIVERGGLTAGVMHIMGLCEVLNVRFNRPWGTGSGIRQMPIGSYLKSIGQN